MARFDDEKDGGDQGGGGEAGGKGGKSGQVEFHLQDPLLVRTKRIEQLPPEERKRILSTHKDVNVGLVEKQKKLRESRKNAKAGQKAGYQMGGYQGGQSSFRKHPVLGKSPEFDGMDPQVNLDPTQYEADTNPERQKELTYEYQPELKYQNRPTFNPKPTMR